MLRALDALPNGEGPDSASKISERAAAGLWMSCEGSSSATGFSRRRAFEGGGGGGGSVAERSL